MSDIVEYLKNQATIALKNGNKLSCAALTLASQLVSATQENESLRQQLADTQRKLEAAQSRHEAEREALVKDAERYRWLREQSRDPDADKPYCVITKEVLEHGKPARMVSYLKFDEALDEEIDAAIALLDSGSQDGAG